MAAIDRFERYAPAMFKHAVGDGNVLETTARLRTEFDTSGVETLIWCLRLVGLESTGYHATLIKSTHVTVGDGHHLRILEAAQGITGFEHDGIVPGGVDATVGDADVPTTVDVESIPVGVHLHIVQGHVFHPGGQEGKVTAMQHGEVLNIDVYTFLEGDGFVARPDNAAFFTRKAIAIDRAITIY